MGTNIEAEGDDEFPLRITRLLQSHPAIASVRLVGSRAEHRATAVSDWDFAVDAPNFPSAAAVLPILVRPLAPLGTFWDPLSQRQCFIAILPGPRKVDFIFQERHRQEPPYVVGTETLAAMDVHFWDWILWLVAKESAGRSELVTSELQKMHYFLTGPLGVPGVAPTLGAAVQNFLEAREQAEMRFGCRVRRDLSNEVIRFLVSHGYTIENRGG
ncbi:MAG: nucleotidyltransferase domain-containing protein [Thermoplasmata archaeon]